MGDRPLTRSFGSATSADVPALFFLFFHCWERGSSPWLKPGVSATTHLMTRSYRECGPVIKNRFLVSMLGGGSSSPWLKPGASRPRTGYEQCALTIAWFKKPRGMRPRCAWTRRVVLCGLLTLILHRGPSPSDRPDTMIPISSVTIPPGRDVCRLRGHVENGLAKNRPDDILCSEASPSRAGACHRSSPLNGGRCHVSPRTAYRLSVLG